MNKLFHWPNEFTNFTTACKTVKHCVPNPSPVPETDGGEEMDQQKPEQ